MMEYAEERGRKGEGGGKYEGGEGRREEIRKLF